MVGTFVVKARGTREGKENPCITFQRMPSTVGEWKTREPTYKSRVLRFEGRIAQMENFFSTSYSACLFHSTGLLYNIVFPKFGGFQTPTGDFVGKGPSEISFIFLS